MLGEHVITTGAKVFAVAYALGNRVVSRLCFQIFEAISGDQDGFRWLIHPVVRPAYPLQKPGAALRRTHLHDAIDIAPIDAEIERRGADERTQPALRHRPFNLAPRLRRQRSVVNANGKFRLVRIPQLLKNEFGQKPGITEYKRRLVFRNNV